MEKVKKRKLVDKLHDLVIKKPGALTFTILVTDSIVLLLSIVVHIILLVHREKNFYVSDLLQIISYNVSIVSLTIAVVQLSNFLYHNKFDMRMRTKEKSIKVAQIYARDILCETSFVCNVLNKHFNANQINSLKSIEHHIFNQEQYNKLNLSVEVKNVFDKDGEEISIETIEKNKFVSKMFSGDYDDFSHINENELKKEYNRRFRGTIFYTLNLLEGLAMEINDGVCDGELLFRPLHTSFIDFIEMVSPCIYTRNIKTEEVLYSNVTKLYKNWVNKSKANTTVVASAYESNTNSIPL